ncbi:NotI family restriction endonuclease [Hydrogenophaga intermedia]|uniref:NotI family restriction endonuclease n=1 Tax=Hydrogenophaga intermedia TaxID=65786 RepID=UPI0009E9C698|nr:NotI family restriction endonuclease [Hydrogenophaga intermedia]TMU77925.1 hypothetical protein FGJ01_00825 [Hydrogenophaga intermedia]
MPDAQEIPDVLPDDAPAVAAFKWGPSEWFGLQVNSLSNEERLAVAQDALKPHKEADRECPHLTALTNAPYGCSKAGGVCTVQRYAADAAGVKATGQAVAICPARLVSRDVLRSIAKTVLGLDEGVMLVKEVPYSLNMTKVKKSGEPSWAGRIDWLLVDGNNPKRFAAVETQAVYMSGKSQDGTFKAFVDAGGEMAMPPDYRHPDYKSSVPKRLAPQLESKARHLSSTSRKTVVIVDEFVLSIHLGTQVCRAVDVVGLRSPVDFEHQGCHDGLGFRLRTLQLDRCIAHCRGAAGQRARGAWPRLSAGS